MTAAARPTAWSARRPPFFAAIAEAYDALAAAEPERFTVIDAAAPPKTVLVEATAAVVPLLQ